ncbi:lipoprotein [Arsenophonus sp. aPb]|uniref:lipoprotein n=1 Tax=Arsenophonus sp. aPb TaxID=3041619 RepID=UPI002468684A|nr:lipoprotein [Arsenophonus sp. aPb]WGL99534.1 lipoprotein [Arsenophonus sp. aPb]
MKHFFTAALLLLCGVIAGCDQLTEFSISEDTINNYLIKHTHYSKKIGIAGLADASIDLANLSAQIGRTEPNKITLMGVAKINLETLFGSTQAEVSLAITSLPYFDVKTGAIYLKQLEISDHKITPEKMASTISPILPIVNNSLKAYFEKNPVYVLQPEKSKAEALAKKIAKGLEVKPGKLVIPLVE